jgi:hypothetical protein
MHADKNVEYVHLRDFGKKIVYAGWVELFSGTDKVRELVHHDVEVFDFDGNQLISAPRVYIARPMDNIDVEFPAEPSHDQKPAQGHEPAKVQVPAGHEELLQDQALTQPGEPAQDEEPAKDQEHADV